MGIIGSHLDLTSEWRGRQASKGAWVLSMYYQGSISSVSIGLGPTAPAASFIGSSTVAVELANGRRLVDYPGNNVLRRPQS
jgi:hypothetical protein